MSCVYKSWVQYASKSEIELAVFKAFLKLLLGVWVFGLRIAVLLFFGLSFSHTRIYDTHTQSIHQSRKETKSLSPSSN